MSNLLVSSVSPKISCSVQQIMVSVSVAKTGFSRLLYETRKPHTNDKEQYLICMGQYKIRWYTSVAVSLNHSLSILNFY